MALVYIILIILAAIGFVLFEKFRGNEIFDKTNRCLTIKDDPGEARRNEDELLEPNRYRQNYSEEKDYKRPLDITEYDQVDDNGVLLPPENMQ